ncbi:unnamed protein product [Mytilus edulis]|uniref:Uncharacterized protein n=1 Tax=Mytilus edulis TaxID=6550 RepID=A0A8S3Q7E5_MYTED|nr:unnamed protein product [Mytilus edulis]
MQDRLLNLEENNTLLENELQRRDQETIPKHKRAQHEDSIKQWQEDDKKFLLQEQQNIKYEYEIVHSSFVTAPADIINYRNEKRNQVFVIDDICGKKNINLQIVQTWSDLAGPVEEIFKDNVIESQNTTVRTDKTKLAKLLVSCRLEVFKDKWFQQLCCFIKHECNILSDSLCLLPEERLLMIKQYLPNDRIKEVNDILNEFNFFPLLCRLSTDRSSKELRTLFLAPIATIRADLEEIILTENKFKQCALVLCLIFEEGFDEQWLKFKLVSNDIQTKIKRIGEEFDINLDVEILRRSLIDAFCSLTGTYLRNRGTSYEFYHDKIYDTAVIVFGQYFKECLIKYASVSFIGDRYILESVGATNNDSLVIISEDMEESYFCRLLGDLEKKNVNSTLHNKQLVYESFRMKLIKFFEINIDVTTTIFNQLDESGIITSIGYEDDDDDYDDFCIGMNKETQISTSLIESIREGYEDIIEFLIKIGCNVNLFDSNDRSPLYIACELGFTNVVILLINHNCIVSAHGLIDYFPLNIACANGYTEIVKLLIANEIDVSKISFFNGTPLINACKGGHLNIVRLLLQKDADVDECEYFDDDCTPLDVACGGGYTDIVQLLLEKKSDINHNDGAPLFLSCQNGHTDTVKLLLVNNANITPSSFAVACENGYITIVNSLLQNETTISLYVDKLSPLHLASGNGHLNVVETLLNSQINISHFDKWSSLCVASHVGHIDIVKVLVKSETNAAFVTRMDIPIQNITIFHFNKRGQSLLHAACSNIETKDDHLSVINLLLDKKLEISLTDNNGFTPLHFASLGNSDDIVRLLLKRGVDVNHQTAVQGNTSLHLACTWRDVVFQRNTNVKISLCDNNGKSFEVGVSKFSSPFPTHVCYDTHGIHQSIVRLLLEYQADISLCNYKGQTPLHIACESGDYYVVKVLVEIKADITVCDNDGNTPLDLACQREHTDVVTLLLNSITNISQLDNDGKTAFHSACKGYGSRKKDVGWFFGNPWQRPTDTDIEAHKSVIEILRHKKADVNKHLNIRNNCQQTPLHIATEGGHLPLVNMLVERNVDVNMCDNNGQSPLYLACEMRHIDIVKILLLHNANMHLVDNNKRSPFHAVCNGLSLPPTEIEIQSVRDLVSLLIDYKGDLSHPDNDGKIPLHFACKVGCLAIVESLAVKKAHFTVCDSNGQTPLDEAKKAGHWDTVRFLENFEDDTSKNYNPFYFLW